MTALLAFVILFALTSSIAQDYSSIKLLIDGVNNYNNAMRQPDSALLNTACDNYRQFYSFRDTAPDLAEKLEKYFPVASYNLGWCFYRLAELNAEADYYDSARFWFDIPFEEFNAEYDVYRRYMKADAMLHSIYLKMHAGATGDLLSEFVIRNLKTDLQTAGKIMLALETDTSLVDHFRCASAMRRIDAEYEEALLNDLTDDTAQARQQWNDMDYLYPLSAIVSPPPSDYMRVANYSQAMVQFRRFLHDRSSTDILDSLNARMSALGDDSVYYRAHIDFINERYDQALKYYRLSQPLESRYWLAYVYLIQKTSRLENLERSFEGFTEFVDGTANDTVWVSRLKPLVREADKKRRILDIALGNSIPESFYNAIDIPAIRFLMQIGAATTSTQQERCLSALKEVLPRISWLNESELAFYLGIVLSIDAESKSGNTRSSLFESVAEKLASVSGNFAKEAKYIRGRCLVNAKDYDLAERILKELVRDEGSTRALFFLAENYRSQSDKMEMACTISRHIVDAIEASRYSTEYKYLLDNARSNVGRCDEGNYQNAMVHIEGMTSLRFPESLAVISYEVNDKTVTELIQYETLSDSKYIRQAFHDEAASQIRKNDMPKKTLSPNYRGNWYAKITENDPQKHLWHDPDPDPESGETVRDQLVVDSTWNVRLRLVGMRNNVPSHITNCTVVNSRGDTLLCDTFGYFMMDSLRLEDTLNVVVSHADYYPRWIPLSYNEPGIHTATYALTERRKRPSLEDGGKQNEKKQRIVANTEPSPIFAMLCYPDDREIEALARFHNLDSLRDMAYNPLTDEYLITNCYCGNELIRCSGECPPEHMHHMHLSFNSSDSLESPQGIDIDSNGKIYVADWGNHRIAIFDSGGVIIRTLGCYNGTGDYGEGDQLGLAFPIAVSLESDTDGITIEDSTYYRETHLIVTDWYSQIRCTLDGRHLENSDIGLDNK